MKHEMKSVPLIFVLFANVAKKLTMNANEEIVDSSGFQLNFMLHILLDLFFCLSLAFRIRPRNLGRTKQIIEVNGNNFASFYRGFSRYRGGISCIGRGLPSPIHDIHPR